IRHEDIVLRIPGKIGLPVECAYVSDGIVLGVLLTTFDVFFKIIDSFRFAAEHHLDHAVWIEFDDHVRSFIDHPYVVVLIDTYVGREGSGIVAGTPELDELQFFGELEKLRSCPATRAATRTSARVNE